LSKEGRLGRKKEWISSDWSKPRRSRGKGRLTCRSVPHSSREEHGKEEVASSSVVDVVDDGSVEAGFREGAEEGKSDADAEEGLSLETIRDKLHQLSIDRKCLEEGGTSVPCRES
jgi:hypothetical protein